MNNYETFFFRHHDSKRMMRLTRSLTRLWIGRFTQIISAWWLQTSRKFNGREFQSNPQKYLDNRKIPIDTNLYKHALVWIERRRALGSPAWMNEEQQTNHCRNPMLFARFQVR